MTRTLDERAAELLPLRPPVLEILLTLGDGPLHGYAIMQALRDPEGADLRIETGPLYRHLKRLLEASCAGSEVSLVEDMLARERAFFRTFELLHLGPVDSPFARRWVEGEALGDVPPAV